MNLVERFVAGGAGAAEAQGWRPTGSIVLTPRYPDSRHVVVLLLDQTGRPRLVGKVVRAPADPSTLDREAAVLAALDAGGAGERPHSVPRLLALEWVEGHRLMLQTAVAGTPVTHRTVRRRPERWWNIVESWITALPRQSAAGGESDWLESYIGADVALARETLVAAGAMTAPLDRSLRLTIEAVLRLHAAMPHAVVEHGDLSHPNLIWSPAGLGAVDWETGDPRGLPGVDAATFVAFLEFSRTGAHGVGREADVYQHSFVAKDGAGRRRLVRHLTNVGAAPARVDDVLVATWGRSALSTFGRLLTGPNRYGAVYRDRAVRRFLTGRPYALWSATLASQAYRQGQDNPKLK